jgi:FHS family glucose/mannose:H+ symporter-like MFS transporter
MRNSIGIYRGRLADANCTGERKRNLTSLPPSISSLQRGFLAGACCTALFLYAVYLGALSVLMPLIGAGFGLGTSVSGRVFPATFSGFVVGVLLCGYLSDRLGRKWVLLLGIAAYGIGLALFGKAPTFELALIAAALIGAGSGAMETVASALAADLYPERRAFILNAVQIAFGAGAALSPMLAHRYVQQPGADWRVLYFGLAAANALLFLVFAVQRVPHLRDSADTDALDLAALGGILKQPVFVLLCLAQAIYVGAEVGYFSWMPTYFNRQVPGGAAWEGGVVSVFWVAMTIGRIAVASIGERIPPLRQVRFLALGGLVASALTLLWSAPAPVMLFVALTGLCFSGIFSLILADAGARYPRLAGTVFGGVIAVGGIGGALFPWVVGMLAETPVGWRGGLALVPLLSGSLSALALWLGKR